MADTGKLVADKGKRKTARWAVVGLLVVALIGGGGVVAGKTIMAGEKVPEGTPARPDLITPAPQIVPVKPDAPVPTTAGLAMALSKVSASPDLGQLTGQVSDPVTGTVLWEKNPGKPLIPASNAKVLTAAAALLGMDQDRRLTTTVVAGPNGQVILRGAGDPTLSAQPVGAETFFTDAPRIADLAQQIKAAGIKVKSVAIDTSLYSGPTMDKTWDRRDIAGGDITPIKSLIADAGRDDPLDEFSPRTAEPSTDAGKALAKALGVDGDIASVRAPEGAKQLASVKSATLATRVNDMMRFSDNVLAETLGIELSLSRGGPGTLAGGADAVRKTLADKGFDTTGVTLRDTSGLSYGNKVPARVLNDMMSGIAGTRYPQLRVLLDGLPIAAGTGTLATRFNPKKTSGAGWVRAKTGTLTGVSSLTGIVQTVDGRVLSFAMMSNGTSPEEARPALDAVVGKIRDCGCR
ncbi:D-alanyl-D-alanine carboxypeptidase/D-alanyl-D-alanine-endopeptidase [Gordonia sp. (in: high G+C Gram-positive bacteria)]|uniref:D-alanyl-D-alanine carboxypeptidase/D-alanyl-D-alanine endopeptidase n=1 Tax=Gordonia sp. (in: high G+C Gram-positive bacteria) TaxID=84139 RepID=UPI0039E4BDD3